MAVTNPRNRVLIFRLTQEEFTALRAASQENGARSLSDFARARLFGPIQSSSVETQLAELRGTVARLATLLEGGRQVAPLMPVPQNVSPDAKVLEKQ